MRTEEHDHARESVVNANKPARIAAALAVAVVAAIACYIYFLRPSLSTEEVAELLRATQIANAQLENHETGAAIEAFQTIAKRLPDELLPVRNLAIAGLMALDTKGDPAQTEAAINRLFEAESESPESLMLAAAFLSHDRSGVPPSPERDREVVDLLRKAADLAPDDLASRYRLYDTTQISMDATLAVEGHRAIKEAFEIDPQNVHVLMCQLDAQVKNGDPRILDTLESAKQTVLPFRSQIERTKKLDIREVIEQAIEQAEQGDTRGLGRSIYLFRQLLLPMEMTKRDLVKLDPHPLEFALFEFSGSSFKNAVAIPPPKPPGRFELVAVAESQPDVAGANVIRLADFDQDGKLDLLVIDDSKLRVMRRDAVDMPWEELTSIAVPAGMRGVLIGDLDRDELEPTVDGAPTANGGEEPSAETIPKQVETAGGPAKQATTTAKRDGCHDADVDLVVYGDNGVLVLRNNLDEATELRSLELIEQAPLQKVKEIRHAALVDVDQDATLDLVLATASGISIWSGLGESLRFEDITEWSVLPPEDASFDSVVVVDWDRDVDLDVMLVDSSGALLGMLENLRHARFVWRPFEKDSPLSKGAASLAVLESDGNVSWDLVVAGEQGVHLLQTTTPAPGNVILNRDRRISQDAASRLAVLDLDNDGHLDLAIGSKDSLRFYRGDGAGNYSELPELRIQLTGIRDVSVGDLDSDGDLDLAVTHGGGLTLYDNRGSTGNRWIDIRCVGQSDNMGRANHTGLGTLIEIQSGAGYQAQVVTAQTTHFGLGTRQPAVARLLWTNGVPQSIVEPPLELTICEKMELKGSCPFVYTWNGERFDFHTDLLWAAPIGLQLADGVLAPSRSWEYLKIPGSRLQPRDGELLLQITEELWEAGYFDKVELIAVDHPKGSEIHSNEKVGPASIAEFKIHTVRNRRFPVAARDKHGRDVLGKIIKRDDVYLKAYDVQHWQGLTEEHYLELDLGKLDKPSHIMLYLTGWIYPTDTSLNINFSHNPDAKAPRPPSVWTPDRGGEWREAIPYMGFPGGKTKTIAVDLSDAFAVDDYRLRIATSNQIYWDHVFFTADDEPVDVQLTRMAVSAAELHFRGFSARRPRPNHAPDHYDYDNVSTAPKWPPMRGDFTRFGDVSELLLAADDRLVIMAAGDEMTVRFQAPPPPPEGWTRDYLLHNVGWDKDADLNTVHGQTVEPLPFNAMKRYPYDPLDYPATPAIRSYLGKYQTRRQNANEFWRWVKRHRP